MVKFRLREEKLKKKWHGKNDMVPVNAPQFVYVSAEKEEEFYKNMYPKNKEDLKIEEDDQGSALGSIGLKPKIVH